MNRHETFRRPQPAPTLFDLAVAIDETTPDPVEAAIVLGHLIASGRVRWRGLPDTRDP